MIERLIPRAVMVALLLAAPVAVPGAVRAAPSPTQEELARSHFVAGEQEYSLGRWREALREFEAGYALSPRPEFLINFAQVHRKLGEYDAAARECRQYLATAPPSQLATQAQRLLEQIEGERAHSPSKQGTPAVASPANSPPATPPPAAAVNAPVLVAAPPPAPKKRRAWIAPVVVAGVVVVAGAVTLGLVLGLPPHDTFKATPLGTVDFR